MGKVRLSTGCAGVGVGVGAAAGADVNQQSDEGRDWHLHLLYPLWRSGSPDHFLSPKFFPPSNPFLPSDPFIRFPHPLGPVLLRYPFPRTWWLPRTLFHFRRMRIR